MIMQSQMEKLWKLICEHLQKQMLEKLQFPVSVEQKGKGGLDPQVFCDCNLKAISWYELQGARL